MLLQVYSALLFTRFIDQSKTQDRTSVRILTEKFSTSHAVPLSLWFIILLIKTKKSGLPGCKYCGNVATHFYVNNASKAEFSEANWYVLAMFCHPIC